MDVSLRREGTLLRRSRPRRATVPRVPTKPRAPLRGERRLRCMPRRAAATAPAEGARDQAFARVGSTPRVRAAVLDVRVATRAFEGWNPASPRCAYSRMRRQAHDGDARTPAR